MNMWFWNKQTYDWEMHSFSNPIKCSCIYTCVWILGHVHVFWLDKQLNAMPQSQVRQCHLCGCKYWEVRLCAWSCAIYGTRETWSALPWLRKFLKFNMLDRILRSIRQFASNNRWNLGAKFMSVAPSIFTKELWKVDGATRQHAPLTFTPK